MKRQLLILFVFFVSPMYGQRFTLGELIKMTSMNWDNFDTYALMHGYRYSDVSVNKDTLNFNKPVNRIYKGNEKNKENKIINMRRSEVSNDVTIVYITPDVADYLEIKKDLKHSEFKYLSTSTLPMGNSNVIVFDYGNRKIEVSLMTYDLKKTTSNMGNDSEYRIIVTKSCP